MIPLRQRSIRPRLFAAPLFVLSLVLWSVLGLVWTKAWFALLAEVMLYVLSGVTAGMHAVIKAKANPIMILPMAPVFATIHITWGSSFLLRLLRLHHNSIR